MVDLHYRLSKSLDAELPGLATSHHYYLGLSIYMYTHNENHAKFSRCRSYIKALNYFTLILCFPVPLYGIFSGFIDGTEFQVLE